MFKKMFFNKQWIMCTTIFFLIPLCILIPQINQNLIREKELISIAEKYIHSINSGDKKIVEKFILQNYDTTFLKIMPYEYHVIYQMSNFYTSGGEGYVITQIDTANLQILLKNKFTGAIIDLKIPFNDGLSNKINGFIDFKVIGNTQAIEENLIIQKVEKCLKILVDEDEFSGVTLIAKEGKIILNKAFGDANKSYNIPNKIDTKFNIASIGKIFTGIAIAQLVEKGKLSFEDSLSEYIGNDWLSEDISSKIKVKHLLTHTSGLGDYFRQLYNQCDKFIFREHDDYKILLINEKLNFEPGTRWSYSNTGMLLLGALIEKVTSMKYFEYLQQYIFEPADMKNTGGFEKDHPVTNRATGYSKEFVNNKIEWIDNSISRVAKGNSSGGCYSTSEDLFNFDKALRSYKLLSPEFTKLVLSPKPELNSSFYGYGFFINNGIAGKIARHGGDGVGINCHFNMYIDTGYTVVVLSNYVKLIK